MLRLLAFLVVLAASVHGHIGSVRQCEAQVIESAGTGTYAGRFVVTPSSDYASITMELVFTAVVGNLYTYSGFFFSLRSLIPSVRLAQNGCPCPAGRRRDRMPDGTLSTSDNVHFTYESTKSGSAGQTIEWTFQVQYQDKQPLLGELTFNGEDVCGTGGGLTTHPPLANPCPSTGTTPYDYPQVLCMSILFYEAQRSGALPSDQRITWRRDSAMDDGNDVGHDLTGGYYDAGDHVKFGFPMAYVGTVLAWGVIEYGAGFDAAGELDNGRAAVRWVSDYLLKAHTAVGELYGQVGDGNADHNYWGRPEEMTMDRPSAKIDTSNPGSDLAGESAAALAAASILFSDDSAYSASCLDAARDLYDLAVNHRATYTDSIPGAGGFYNSYSGYGDELAWAALWMYKASGEEEFLTAAKGFWTEFNIGADAVQFGWDDKKAGCYVLFSELDGGSTYTDTLKGFVDRTINDATYTPGGLVHLDQWGALRHAMNVAFIAHRAADLGIEPTAYRQWAEGQLAYVLGSTGRSFIVGFGENPPTRPHHRSSSCPQYPTSCTDGWAKSNPGPNPHVLYGAMVGGPDTDDSYVDDRMDYVHNEVATDYNAALVGVLAAVVQNSL